MGEAAQREKQAQFELTIRFNVITHEFELAGFDQDPLIALGMLEFAKHKLQRSITMNEMREEMARAGRIIPGGLPATRGPLG